ncbi:MAG: response regulator [Candidatus Hydrogenedentes bacterium]|nr:response regulator [Candidatus Hydrogenedentota bacterium]
MTESVEPPVKRKIGMIMIDDDPGDVELLRRLVEEVPDWDVDFSAFASAQEGRAELTRRAFDVVLLDYFLGSETGLDLVKKVRAAGDARPIIVLTGRGDEHIAVEVTRAGASDYLVKGELSSDLLRRAINGAIVQHELRKEKALLEEELRQTQRIETIGQLAGGIAHDFNNMLTGIIGHVDLALMEARGCDIETDLLQVQTTCRHMANLIQRLLGFSRRSKSDLGPTDLCQVVREAEMVLSHTIPKNVQIEVKTIDAPLIVNGNGTMLHQVLLNLGINASEAMPKGGTLTIRTRRVVADADFRFAHPSAKEGEYAYLEVEDTGRGIEEANLKRIFEPLFTTKDLDARKGTGLGLAVVWQNIKEHHGFVTVYSEVGQGTVFHLYLPLVAGQAEARHNAGGDGIPTGSETILVVDDEQVVRSVATRMLQRLGYKVYSAPDGAEALSVYENLKDEIDAVLLDLAMPRMGGKECIHGLLAVNPEARVLFSSGHDMTARMQELLDLGAKGVIQKPYQLSDLARRIRSLFADSREDASPAP